MAVPRLSSSVPGRLLALCVVWPLVSCTSTPTLLPLGPNAVRFRGSTVNQSKFDRLDIPRCPRGDGGPEKGPARPPGVPAPPPGEIDPPLNVFSVVVDTRDHRFTGSAAQATTYRDAKRADIQTNANAYWDETSFGNVSVTVKMFDKVLPMAGAFDDYFNRPYVNARLTSMGLAASFPLTVAPGTQVVFNVQDAHGRDKDVTFAPAGTFANAAALVPVCQNAFNATSGVPVPWVTCSSVGAGELRMQLADLETAEASLIRVKSVTGSFPGFNGPEEAPGTATTQASLVGKAVAAPVTLTGVEHVMIEVRDKDLRTRTYDVPFGAATLANASAAGPALVAALNAEFAWVELGNAGPDRVALRVKAGFSGPKASIRVVGGVNLPTLGLDGPFRTDGVITPGGTSTVRGDWSKIVSEALSLYVKRRAADLGIPVDAGHKANLDTLVANELSGFDSYLVLFIEQFVNPAIPGRRAGASGGMYDITVPGTGGFTYQKQLSARLMIGTGFEPWQTWAHEMGHNLGFWDLYWQPDYDTHYNATFDDLRNWSLMSNSSVANHVESWHKHNIQWIPSVAEVGAPGSGVTDTKSFTLTPLEFKFADYSGVGSGGAPARQLVRIKLSDNHWVHLENRQPGAAFSATLPDDVFGWSPANAGGEAGGLLVTDTVDPWAPFFYRPPVTALNPDGSGAPPGGTVLQARAMKTGDTLALKDAYPAYDGISVKVDGKVPGPPGKPEALKVSVTRGPGDFLDLEIRKWHAPDAYATPDIWVDWPGNGEETFAGDPPLGNGDPFHWDPNGNVVNFIKVRVHNRGTVLGKNVVVRAWTNEPPGMGDRGTFQPLPNSAGQDIPAGQSRDYKFEWRPKGKGHTCIRAEVFTHDSAFGDLDPTNNGTQENIDEFAPQAGSPYAPWPFTFKLTNGFDHDVDVELIPSGLADGMDLELESAWFHLGPKEERKVQGRLHVDVTKIPPAPRSQRRCDYRFNLHAFRRTLDSVLPFGGITVNVTPSYGSKLILREPQREKTAGGAKVSVWGRLDGPFNVGQTVDAAIVGSDGIAYGGTATTGAGGVFNVPVSGPPAGTARVTLYYFGPDMTPSSLGPVKVNLGGS